MTSSLPTNFIRPHPDDAENRISRDSGFSSQQLTPTPPQSPSNLDPDTNTTPTPSPFTTPNLSPSASLNTLTPTGTSTPPPSSKSSDVLKQLQVAPASPNRSPSMDFLKRRRKSSPAPSPGNSPLLELASKGKKKERVGSDKGFKKGLFSSRKVKDSTEKGKVKNITGGKGREKSASPQVHRKLQQSLTLSLDGSSVESTSTLSSSAS